MGILKIAAAQFENKNGDKEYNLGVIRSLTSQAVAEGAEAISFHEGSICGYTFLRNLSKNEISDLAELVPDGKSTEGLIAISDEFGIPVFAGLLELGEDGNFYNTYICVHEGRMVAKFRKLHAFINPYLSSGSEYCVFDLLGWKIGILICYDTHIPENVRITTLLGAEIIIMPNVTGCLPGTDPGNGFVERELWDNREIDPISIQREFMGPKGRGLLLKWLPTRAYENGVYVVFSNPVGVDDDQIRMGNAIIVDPNGNIIAETHKLGDDVTIAPCNQELGRNSLGRKNFLKARRPELYGELVRPSEVPPITGVPWI